GGAPAAARTIAFLAACALDEPAAHGAFFLCGADIPADVDALVEAIGRTWVREATVDNDTFALLRTGTDSGDAVAVICGGGFNCVGRAADGRTARYPSLGWETGDWGGSEMLGRDVLFHAARAEDGRAEPSVLAELVTSHFGLPTVAAVGEAVHYGRLPHQRLGELAPGVFAAAEAGDVAARSFVDRLAGEVALAAWRALRDLDLLGRTADVVLGGGLLHRGEGMLHREIVARLAARAPHARPVVATEPPVLGAALAALEAAGAPAEAEVRLRAAFARGLTPDVVA
ncbi:MAG TPA: BadF/BadG/BcrA/BcrD ATPase family protein, partial [Gaiellaceae bacterium]